MIIIRYFVKEVLLALLVLTIILLTIFLSNQFVHYLSRSAAGQFPGMAVLQLMLLDLPNLLGYLLPLGFFIALLLTYSRLYAESEMAVLQACGVGPGQLTVFTFVLALYSVP